MQGYDAVWFSPPAPLARVALRNPGSGIMVPDIPMLLDTGADVTLVPKSAVYELGLTPGSEASYELIAFDGSRSVAQAIRLDLIFLKKTFKGQFLMVDQEWGLVGRDVLNHVSLLFDGPRLQWGE